MSLERFLELLAVLFGALGSIYVLKGILSLTPDLVERLAGTYFGFSLPQVDSLVAQKADGIVGVSLVGFALLVSLAKVIFVSGDIPLFETRSVALAIAAVTVGIIYAITVLAGQGFQKKEGQAVRYLIATKEISSLIAAGKLPQSEIGSLNATARDLLGLTMAEGESPRALFERACALLKLQVPKGFDFTEVDKPLR